MMHKRIMTLMMMVFMASLHASGQEWKIMKPYVTNGVDFRLHEMCEQKKACITLEAVHQKNQENDRLLYDSLIVVEQRDLIQKIINSHPEVTRLIGKLKQLATSQTTECTKLKLELDSVNNNSALHEICEKIVKSNSEIALIQNFKEELIRLERNNEFLANANMLYECAHKIDNDTVRNELYERAKAMAASQS